MYSSQLLDRTLELVRNRPISCTYKEIEKQTNISPRWIKHLMNGRLMSIDVRKLETLYCLLAKSTLFTEV